ncbi:dihydrofolate reductase family protein [Sediminivirga luteola]|uniref:Bacterial bifunctional deaminase-reductase C-terminal domain-containing protein n=1 Tax=Sediminivirga luteola TaxID=1774748 RepID=A0A8J2XKA1_9MICO|nr:dihydrofolate reductase family protein [Sediminivirga luteola]GGA08026.1 hypothetical protein GCM10011333_08550 [Sediminivirga luteola]
MGRIIFDTATTLNGWIADEEHSLEWLFSVPVGEAPAPELAPPDAAVTVMGSSTYEWVLRQEGILQAPEKWQTAFGSRPVLVFTSRELAIPAGADVRLVSGSVDAHLQTIRDLAGDGDVWVVGGGDLAGQFADAGALDEVRLSIAPVALPAGAPLLPRKILSDRLSLREVSQVGAFARLIYELR